MTYRQQRTLREDTYDRDFLRRKFFAKFQATGISDREDRLYLLNEILAVLFPEVEGEICSLDDMTDVELARVIDALSIWEMIQEARLHAGTLHLDNKVTEQSIGHFEARKAEQLAWHEALSRAARPKENNQ